MPRFTSSGWTTSASTSTVNNYQVWRLWNTTYTQTTGATTNYYEANWPFIVATGGTAANYTIDQ